MRKSLPQYDRAQNLIANARCNTATMKSTQLSAALDIEQGDIDAFSRTLLTDMNKVDKRDCTCAKRSADDS
jgi:hypothetical protein